MKKGVLFLCLPMLLAGCNDDPGPAPEPPKLPLTVCLGSLHAHSTYSSDVMDGTCTVEENLRLAREIGHAFWAITDHTRTPYGLSDFETTSALTQAASDDGFVALCGFEYTNDKLFVEEGGSTSGTGYLNVYGTDSFVDGDKVDFPAFYDWLCSPENSGVVACFDHPKISDFDGFRIWNRAVLGRVTMLEAINVGNSYYDAWVKALSTGWLVAPVAGCDNHTLAAIGAWQARTGLAVTALTPEGVLEAMRERRTYASLDSNLSLLYYANNRPMGARLDRPTTIRFDVIIDDPDTDDPAQRITRVDIVGADDRVILSTPFAEPLHHVEWSTTFVAIEKYYYLLVYNASSDAPVAYSAPVWTGR